MELSLVGARGRDSGPEVEVRVSQETDVTMPSSEYVEMSAENAVAWRTHEKSLYPAAFQLG